MIVRLLCLLLFAASLPVAASAEELGRLFFTPERRLALDRQRQFNLIERQETPQDPTLTINGVVTRSSGKRTVWINGIPQEGSDAAITPSRSNPGKVVVQPDRGPATNASVGDTVNRNTGETDDLLDGGRIQIRTAPRR